MKVTLQLTECPECALLDALVRKMGGWVEKQYPVVNWVHVCNNTCCLLPFVVLRYVFALRHYWQSMAVLVSPGLRSRCRP